MASLARSSVARACALLFGLAGVVLPQGVEAQDSADCEFVRGNLVNLEGDEADVVVDLNDAVDLVAYLLISRSVPVSGCKAAADVNDDGLLTMADYTYLVEHLFNDGPPPPAPYPEPGVDPTDEITISDERDERFSLAIGTTAGAAGNTGLSLPITISNSVPITGLQIALTYDPAQIRIDEIQTEEETLLSSVSAEYITAEFHNNEGVAYIAVLKDFATPFYFHTGEDRFLPAGDDQLVATLKCALVFTAVKGFAPIQFADGIGVPSGEVPAPPPELVPELHTFVFDGTTPIRPVLGTDGGIEVRESFIRGDANFDRVVDIADPVYKLNYIFGAGPAPICLDAADANNDTGIDISDPIWLLNYLFKGGPQPPEPFPQPGVDPSDDGSGSLGCDIE